MTTALAIATLLVQLLNLGLIFRLISITGRRVAWLFIGSGMIVATLRRGYTLWGMWTGTQPASNFSTELLFLGSAILSAIGLYLIKPLFESIRATEQAARSSEEQYRTLFEYSPLAVIICQDGRVEYANRSALAIFGADRLDQLLDRPLTEFVQARDRNLVAQQFKQLSESHPTSPLMELHGVRKDHRTVDIEVLLSLFVYAGKLAQYVVLWDISDRKRREEALREREAELAHVMRLHTMGEIAAEMAHEINQPLYAISNFAQAGILHLQSGEPERMAQLQTCLEHVHTQAGRAAQIVKNLRNFVSKSEGEFVDVSFHKLVRDAVELVEIEARRRKATIELALAAEDALIHVNAVQIQQVLVNLLINAFDAMQSLPEYQRRVRIITCADKQTVELAVEDNGSGIPEDKLTRVFEPFFTTKSQGMGMGLAVSRTIIINHGGKIWAERNDLGGTTFRVTLPHGE